MSGETDEDPSSWTPDLLQQQVDRGNRAERDWVIAQLNVRDARIVGVREVLVQRLDDIDRATQILSDTVNRVPTDLQQAMGSMQALQDVRFGSIQLQFAERDERAARESRDNKIAVDAAFAAQKEAAAATDKANSEAIRKSEAATAETIKTNADAQRAGNSALSDKIEDVKDRMNRLELLVGGIQAGASGGSVQRDNTLKMAAFGVSVLLLILTGLAVYAALKP